MGIPSYFFEIIKKYGERFFGASKGSRGVGRLFLDLNCCIHGCKNRVLNRWKKSIQSHPEIELGRAFEDDIIKEVIRTIIRLTKEVAPSNLLWIAVDGVVPLAKMKQQRERRLRSIQTRDEIRRIYECHEREHPIEWDSNAITPGTQFMIRMCKTIQENLEMIRSHCGVASIGMNGVDTPGEGEQKIFEYMRNYPGDDSGLEDIIYGLDADLIILSILQRTVADQDSPIALLREKVHFGRLLSTEQVSKPETRDDEAGGEDDDEMIRFRVSEFADLIPREWGGGRKGSPTQSLLCDYVILVSLMGNDFVPHCPSLTFRTGGMERLLEAYRTVGSHIIVPDPNPDNDLYIIDWSVIGQICEILAEDEEKILREDEEKMAKIQERILAGQIPYRHSIVDDPLQQDIIALDWEHIRYHSPIVTEEGRGYGQSHNHSHDQSSGKWDERFYRRVLGNRGEWSSQKLMVKTMMNEYKSAIQWCWDYYCGYDVPADRYYPFVSGPLMKDMATYFKKIKITPKSDIDPLDMDDDMLEAYMPAKQTRDEYVPGSKMFTVNDIVADAQLIAVLPPQSHHLLSESARKVARECVELYPDMFDFWDYCKKHEWEREGYLPLIPIKQIRDLIVKNV